MTLADHQLTQIPIPESANKIKKTIEKLTLELIDLHILVGFLNKTIEHYFSLKLHIQDIVERLCSALTQTNVISQLLANCIGTPGHTETTKLIRQYLHEYIQDIIAVLNFNTFLRCRGNQMVFENIHLHTDF